MENKAKTGYVVAGATIALASSALILDFIIRKRAKKAVMVAGILVGAAGVAAGLAVASYPKLKAIKKLNTNKLFDINDINLMDKELLAELGEVEDEYAELSIQKTKNAPAVIELPAIDLQEAAVEVSDEEVVEMVAEAAPAVEEPTEVAEESAEAPVEEVAVSAEAEQDTETIDDLSMEIEFDM